MTEMLPLFQMHQALTARLVRFHDSKLELADGIRECCADLPLSEPLTVAGHVVEWVNAQCSVHLQSAIKEHQMWHVQRVLLIDGRLVPEAVVESTKYFNEGITTFNGLFKQGRNGWYLVESWRVYDRQNNEWMDDPSSDEKRPTPPKAFLSCDLPMLQEVSQAIPDAVSTWHVQRHAYLEAQTVKNRELAAVLGR